MKVVVASGKRKSAVAKAKIKDGAGQVTYNGVPYNELRMFHRLALSEPVEICRKVIGDFKFDISVTAVGGGTEGQVQAARLAIAKALIKFTGSNDLKKAIVEYDRKMLVADTRRKEAYKPGDSKARAMRQSSKR